MMKIICTIIIFLNLLHTVAFAMNRPEKDMSPPFSVTTKKTNYRLFSDLTRNNAALLKRLVAEEKLKYCPQLRHAETVLVQDLSKKNKKKWLTECDPEAVSFVFLIARKNNDCKRLIDAMDKKDPLAVENILCTNPYVANHYFVRDKWEGNITLLHYVFSQAVSDQHYEYYMIPLLKAYANPNAVDGEKNTLMHKASTCAQVDLLWKYGASSEEINQWGDTPLMSAIIRRCPLVASYLIANLVDLAVQNTSGHTALHLAVFNKDEFIMKKLLERDASFEVRDADYRSPAYYASKKPALKDIMNSYIQLKLWRALCNEDEFMIAELVKNNPWMDYMLEGRPLMKWVKEQCSDKAISFFEKMLTEVFHNTLFLCPQQKVEQLIIAGAQINTQLRSGVSPLQFVLDRDDEGLIMLLLKHGALVTKPMIQATKEGKIRTWLETSQAEQSCCVCYGNCDQMTDLFCKNRHPNSFICIDCYNRIKESKYNNNCCPLCQGKLSAYGT